MKKIVSLFLAVLTICTMLSAFAVPAFAEEEGTEFQCEVLALTEIWSPSEILTPVMQIITNKIVGNLELAVDPFTFIADSLEEALDYLLLHEKYEHGMFICAMLISEKYSEDIENGNISEMIKDPIYDKFLACPESAVALAMAEGDPEKAANVYTEYAYLCRLILSDEERAIESLTKGAELLVNAAEQALKEGDWVAAVDLYYLAVGTYEYDLEDEESAEKCRAKIAEINMEHDPHYVSPTGSALSGGSLAVITAVAGIAVGFIAAMLIFRKKKPAGAAE